MVQASQLYGAEEGAYEVTQASQQASQQVIQQPPPEPYPDQDGQCKQVDDGRGHDEEGYEDYGLYGAEEGAYEVVQASQQVTQQPPVEPYQDHGGQLQQVDDGMGYDEEGYEDYGQYGAEEGTYEGTLVDADGSKGTWFDLIKLWTNFKH